MNKIHFSSNRLVPIEVTNEPCYFLYTTSAFLRMKLGESLKQRDLAPHIYENREEATEHLAEIRRSNP